MHVEDEKHVLLQREKYDTIRENLFQKAVIVRRNFYDLPDDEKIVFLFSDENMNRVYAIACFMILPRRAAFLYK